ncbi:MAG: hypothetical protein ACRELD_06405 [Longimicrobiales bacterium]
MIERAVERRAEPVADSGLIDYQADARGFVYFFLDREDTEERTLIKTDQVALELYWSMHGLSKQRIVGLRDESRLPNRMHYHLDHLTVVQNEFGDLIRMGDGDEVRDVPHPAAPGADSVYQYRLADSLSLYLPGSREPIRVYELQVRPRDFGRSAIIGSLFVDRATADIVKLTFTFTPASYVDRRLDYIRVSLENGLWEGRYWLPYEQRVEIRRQLPELDLPAGAIIRGRFQIGDYELNTGLPIHFFSGRRVEVVSEAEREAFPFEEALYADLGEEGLERPADLASLRSTAIRIAGERRLSGLPRLRLLAPGASSVLRYNRAEGLFLGAGVSAVPQPGAEFELAGGYAFAAQRPAATASLSVGQTIELRAFHRELRDLGPYRGTAGLLNTFAAGLAGRDYLDPYFASGAALRLRHALGNAARIVADARLEEHHAATLNTERTWLGATADFRPLPPITTGVQAELDLGVDWTRGTEHTRQLAATINALIGGIDGAYARHSVSLRATQPFGVIRTALRLHADAAAVVGEVPVQRLFFLGGRGTVPGYAFRDFVGDRMLRLSAEAVHSIWDPWLTLRGVAYAAAVRDTRPQLDIPQRPPLSDPRFGTGTSAGLLSAGLGIGLLADVLRLDLVRGLGEHSRWELVVSARDDLYGIL